MDENFGLIWKIYFELSEGTQEKLTNSADNLRSACALKGQNLSMSEAMYVIFQTVKLLDGKDVKR